MGDKTITNGLIVLGAGFLASSVSSFLEHFAILGTATDFAAGFFDGLAKSLSAVAVAFGVAIFVLARSLRPKSG